MTHTKDFAQKRSEVEILFEKLAAGKLRGDAEAKFLDLLEKILKEFSLKIEDLNGAIKEDR